MSKQYLQKIEQSGKGVDVTVSIDGKLHEYENVSANVVRCAIGSDYEYFERRSIDRDGQDRSRPLTAGEIEDFGKHKA